MNFVAPASSAPLGAGFAGCPESVSLSAAIAAAKQKFPSRSV